MATSQATPATTAVVVSGGGTTSQTIFGSHIFTIEGFSATKDLGIGKSVKSSIFRVGGHSWYIECYPCGDDEASAGWVTLYLRRQKEDDHPIDIVRAKRGFTLMMPSCRDDGGFQKLIGHGTKWITMANDDRLGTELIKTKEVVSLLNDDCFHVRCDLRIEKVPHPDLGKETMAAGSHVLTIDEYSKARRGLVIGEPIESSKFHVGGHTWYFVFYPCGDDNCYKEDNVSVNLFLDNPPASDDEVVKVLFEIALLTDGGQIISSTQDFSNFSKSSKVYCCGFLAMMEHETWPVLHDGIHIRCDIAVVKKRITVMPNLRRDLQGCHQQIRVSGDVTFEVSGNLFEAHKCVLATRCTAFMAEFFAPAGKKGDNAGATEGPVRVNDMEPRVFEALLHFIYTDALPEVRDEDMLVMARALLVAADRYAMERLKLICGDIMGTYVNDARTAIATLELADKHGCSRLKEVCMKFLKGHFASGAP